MAGTPGPDTRRVTMVRRIGNLAGHVLAAIAGFIAALPVCALIFWLGDLYLY